MIPLAFAPDPTDVVGRRIGAYVIDSLLATVALVAIVVLGNFHFYERTAPPEGASAIATCDRFNQVDDPDATGPFIDEEGRSSDTTLCIPLDDETIYVDLAAAIGSYLAIYALSFIPIALNRVVLEGLTGATVGKHAVGLRTVREDGTRCGVGRAALRTLLLLVDGQVFIGFILIVVTQGHRRLGDMAAGTYVVPKAAMGSPVIVPPKGGAAPMGYTPGYPQPATAAGWPAYPPVAPPAGSVGSAAATPSTDGPHWDPDRDAYIRYDRDQGVWLQWSEARRQWGDIDT